MCECSQIVSFMVSTIKVVFMVSTIKVISSPPESGGGRGGLKKGIFCFNKSKIAQAEYKAKARFLALLRRRRFSRQRKEHRQSCFRLIDDAKVRHKKRCLKNL